MLLFWMYPFHAGIFTVFVWQLGCVFAAGSFAAPVGSLQTKQVLHHENRAQPGLASGNCDREPPARIVQSCGLLASP